MELCGGQMMLGPSSRRALGLMIASWLLAGCGSGGGGRHVAILETPVAVQSVQVDPALPSTQITFTILSPHSHSVSVAILCSEDRGRTFHPVTVEAEQVQKLSAAAGGTPHRVLWEPEPDLSHLDQADLVIRVVPTDDVTGTAGAAARSPVFGLGANTPPEIISVETPAATQGGQIAFSYEVRDVNEDHIGLLLAYSLDEGDSWHAGTPGAGGDGVEAVPTTARGVARTVTWHAQIDSPSTVTPYMLLQITPVDVASGQPGTTEFFAVNLIAPSLELLTIGDIPDYLNGSVPYADDSGNPVSFHVSVPPHSFRLRARFSALPGGADVAPDTLRVTASAAMGNSPAQTDLADFFAPETGGASWLIPSQYALAFGTVALQATIEDELGNVSNLALVAVKVVPGGGVERPFDNPDVWWIDFGSDYFAIDATFGGTVTIQTSPGGNGIADFLEDLWLVGLQTHDPTPACEALGTNEILAELAREEVMGRLRELFGGEFDGEGDGFQTNLIFTLHSTGSTSAIRVGGDDLNAGFTLGRAQFDYRNNVGNDNRSTILGIFVTNMIEYYINISPTFRSRFDALIAGRGLPAGEGPHDHVVLHPSFDRMDPGNTLAENIRYDKIWLALDAWGRSVAVTLGHEIGHSVGLCANGAPPLGLFGNMSSPEFAGPYTNDYHFDSPGNNIMSAALSFSITLVPGSSGYRFNGLSEAYLREWIILQD